MNVKAQMTNDKMTIQNLRLYCLLLIVFLLPSYLVRFSILGVPTTLLEILIYLAVIGSLFNFQDWKKLRQIPRLIGWAVGLFVLSAIMGVLVSPHKIAALGQLKGFIIDPLLLMALIYIWLPQEKISHLYGALAGSGMVVSLIALYQKLAGMVTFDNRALSVWQWDPGASPNYLSLYLAPIAIVAFTKIFYQKNLKAHILYSIFFILILSAVYLSGSRGGLLAVGAGIVYWLIASQLSKTKISPYLMGLLSIILAAGLLAGLWLTGRPNFSAPEDSGRISSSNNIRWEIWRVTVKEIIPSHWLTGIGLANFQNHFTQLTADRVNFPEYISPKALFPHNLFLTLLTNGGIIMLGSFLLPLYLLYTHPGGNLLTEKTVMLGMLVYGLIDTPFFKNDLSILVWLILTAYVIKTQKNLLQSD